MAAPGSTPQLHNPNKHNLPLSPYPPEVLTRSADQDRQCLCESSLVSFVESGKTAGPRTPAEKLFPPRSQSPGRCVGAVGSV